MAFTLHAGYFCMFLSSTFSSKLTFIKKVQDTTRVPNSLDPGPEVINFFHTQLN